MAATSVLASRFIWKIEKPLAKPTDGKRFQINKIRYENGQVKTNLNEIQRIIKE